MEIECEKESLLELSQAVLRVVSPRANTPALGGIRISAREGVVELAASDLETFMTVTGECSVVKEGAVVLPGRLFGEILRSLPSGWVTISGADGEARVEAGRSEFSMATFPVSDFPRPPTGDATEVCRVEGAHLARALKQVGKAASGDEGRPVLTGVLWAIETGSLKVVATDSYRLAVSDLLIKEGPESAQAIIPNRALVEFARHLSSDESEQAEVWLGESQAVLSFGHVKLVTRQIEGEFPNWRRLIPEQQKSRLAVDRESFGAAVARVGLVAQANTPVRFHLGPEVQLTASESGVAEAAEFVEEAEYEGEPMVVAFNPRFFLDGLEGVEAKRALLELTEPTKPATLKGENQENYTYLVMPVRLPS
ncbi:MAG: DNA polymerase III subunit beta [Actinomycetota bacterium]|nr:DNA polymerase III subunit beta [Actinomycetota bacterium]